MWESFLSWMRTLSPEWAKLREYGQSLQLHSGSIRSTITPPFPDHSLKELKGGTFRTGSYLEQPDGLTLHLWTCLLPTICLEGECLPHKPFIPKLNFFTTKSVIFSATNHMLTHPYDISYKYHTSHNEDLISHHVKDPCVSYSDCCRVLTYSCLQTARSCLIAQFGTTWHEMEILMCLFFLGE